MHANSTALCGDIRFENPDVGLSVGSVGRAYVKLAPWTTSTTPCTAKFNTLQSTANSAPLILNTLENEPSVAHIFHKRTHACSHNWAFIIIGLCHTAQSLTKRRVANG